MKTVKQLGGPERVTYLLKGPKRPPQLEFQLQVGKSFDVRYVGRVMVRVVPRPRATPVVVVVKGPLDGPNVAFGLAAQHFTKTQS